MLDVIALPDRSTVIGVHLHRKGQPAFPGGGAWGVEVPSDSPSRAYAKIEEALAWSGITPRVGATALEIGAARGGRPMPWYAEAFAPAEWASIRARWNLSCSPTGTRAAPASSTFPKRSGPSRAMSCPSTPPICWSMFTWEPQVILSRIHRLLPPLRGEGR